MDRRLDVSQVTFMVTRNPEPRSGGAGDLRAGEDAPDWRLQLLALGNNDAELIEVVVRGQKPAVLIGQWVSVTGLEVPRRALKPGKALRAHAVRSLQV